MSTKVLFPRARNLENGWKLAQLPRDLGFPREHMAPGGSMSHRTPHGLWRRRRRMLAASIHGVLPGSCKLGMSPPSSQPRTLRGNWGPRRLTGPGPQSSAEQDKARSDWLRSPWPWLLSFRAVQGLKHRPRPLDDTQLPCLQPLHPQPRWLCADTPDGIRLQRGGGRPRICGRHPWAGLWAGPTPSRGSGWSGSITKPGISTDQPVHERLATGKGH